jgi:hypothetical protein
VKLPDGTPYDQTGKIDYIDPSVSAGTDTILVRARDRQSGAWEHLSLAGGSSAC